MNKLCYCGCKFNNLKWKCKFFNTIKETDQFLSSKETTKSIPVSCFYKYLKKDCLKSIMKSEFGVEIVDEES